MFGVFKKSKKPDFWRIIKLFDWGKAGDDEAVIEPAVEALARCSPDEIVAWYEEMSALLYELDTKAHAQNIGQYAYVDGKKDSFSADWFLYARCVVVANGPNLYNSVLRSPTHFPKDIEFEALLNVAPEAYQRATQKELDVLTEKSFETYSNAAGWEK